MQQGQSLIVFVPNKTWNNVETIHFLLAFLGVPRAPPLSLADLAAQRLQVGSRSYSDALYRALTVSFCPLEVEPVFP